jgi:hypothetical protein
MAEELHRPNDWVDDICARHCLLIDAMFLARAGLRGPLTKGERLDFQRVESLLDAWEAWDLGRHVQHLGYYRSAMARIKEKDGVV